MLKGEDSRKARKGKARLGERRLTLNIELGRWRGIIWNLDG